MRAGDTMPMPRRRRREDRCHIQEYKPPTTTRYPNVHIDNELGEAVQQRGVNIMYIKVYEDKLATLESTSFLSL